MFLSDAIGIHHSHSSKLCWLTLCLTGLLVSKLVMVMVLTALTALLLFISFPSPKKQLLDVSIICKYFGQSASECTAIKLGFYNRLARRICVKCYVPRPGDSLCSCAPLCVAILHPCLLLIDSCVEV